jgi:hypothetical protein
VSVHGEFKRVLADLVTFLNATGNAACAATAVELEACSASAAEEGLGGAAERALEICAALDTAALTPTQREECADRSSHLGAICRALLP